MKVVCKIPNNIDFLLCLQQAIESHFKERMNSSLGHLSKNQSKHLVDDDIRSLIFGDFLSGKEDERVYDEIMDLEELREAWRHTKASTWTAIYVILC